MRNKFKLTIESNLDLKDDVLKIYIYKAISIYKESYATDKKGQMFSYFIYDDPLDATNDNKRTDIRIQEIL
jgi:hypothetical protein